MADLPVPTFKEQRVKPDSVHLKPASVESSRLEGVRSWVRGVLGLDRAIIYTIMARAWASAAGLVTVILIARFLSLDEQGYYYTFGSLVAIQIVFELGFSYVILQMASHERVFLTISPQYDVSGDPVAHARLASVLQKAVRWYSFAAVLMLVALLPAGFHFFATHQHGGHPVAWRLPWCITALAAAFAFQLDPMLSFLEGCGFVARVARLRLAQAMAGGLLAWAALLTHHGLFAPALTILGTASTGFVWLTRKRKLLLGLLRHSPGQSRIEWRKEVWPFQWRIAVSWLCGYFLFQLFNPMLFAFRGPIAAGQMGMSLTLVNALQAVAISWVTTKSAPFGGMIARRDFVQLDRVFFRALVQAVCVFIAGALFIWLGSVYLNTRHFAFAQRLLRPSLLALLLLTASTNIVVSGQALYLRAHKQEKFLLNSVFGALLVSASTYFLGRSYGAEGIVYGYFVLAISFGLTSATYVFKKYRKLWHE
jgi:O-antigen/teichoic acid export membrane protein